MVPPVVLDIDGTLTLSGSTRSPVPIDPRLFDRLRTWEAPVILATGKAFPFAVGLCQFIGLPTRVVAETGGIVCNGEQLEVLMERDRPRAVVREMRKRGYQPGDSLELINRWRETESAFLRSIPREALTEVAAAYDLEVVDTGYAYHVKDPNVSKGKGLEQLLDWESIEATDCVAVGDSVNDVSTFQRVGRSFAVANADTEAKQAADEVLQEEHADGTLAVLDTLVRDSA